MSRSTGTPTKAEAHRIRVSKMGPCMACIVHGLPSVGPCDYHHTLSGGIRRGHMAGFALCGWHHRGLRPDGLSVARMLAEYGPSITTSQPEFTEAYGSDDDLIAMQTDHNRGEL